MFKEYIQYINQVIIANLAAITVSLADINKVLTTLSLASATVFSIVRIYIMIKEYLEKKN